ncbi:MAG: 3-hydroxyacyl-ACP dehydratase FabZ [Pseudomonadota bacterium]
MEPVYDIQKIMGFLPHRYPFILIDRVLELVPGERITALKNVTINEPFFQGHFPGTPIMPGVLMVEAMAQAGGVLAFASSPEDKQGKLLYLTGVDKVRFRRQVVPGDQLIISISVIRRRGLTWLLKAEAFVEEKLAVGAELLAMMGK